MVAGRHGLGAVRGKAANCGSAQWCHVSIAGGHLLCAYLPPQAPRLVRRDLYTTLTQQLARLGENEHFFLVADWNDEPEGTDAEL